METVWVYKVNSKSEHGAHWDDYFRSPGISEWGGTAWAGKQATINVIRNELRKGDWVIAHQTDERRAIGLCKIHRLQEVGDEMEIYLRNIGKFVRPIAFHQLKALAPSAFKQGDVKTLYRIPPSEAAALLQLAKRWLPQA